MSGYYCVDRIEGEYAVIECPNGNMIDIKCISLPSEIKEGDCLKIVNGEWHIDNDEKNKRIKRIQELLNRIKSKQ